VTRFHPDDGGRTGVGSDAQVTTSVPVFNPADLLPIEEVARRLHTNVSWVREKVRRRCPNAIPCYNLGKHLLFSWPDVCTWIRETGRGVPHVKHHRTRKVKKAA
jgi:hypothetical protein